MKKNNKFTLRIKKHKNILLLLFLAIAIEVLVCNYTSLRVYFIDNKNVNAEFTLQKNSNNFNTYTSLPEYNSEYSVVQKSLILDNIDFDIYSINLNSLNISESMYATIEIVGSNKSNIEGDIAINNTIAVKTVNLLKQPYVNIYIDKDDYEKIYINCSIYGSDVNIDEVILNKVNFHFNFIRMIVIFFIILIFYFVRNKVIYKIDYDKKNKLHNDIFLGVIVVTISIIFIFCIFEYFCYPEKILFTDDEVEQYTNGAFVVDTMMLQTKSILDGNIDLGKMTDDKITSLENPYDITSRTRFDVNYLFDSAYYNGKFYQYFSILPVIFFMLPIRLITGYYVLSKVVNTFLFVILCILISITYKKVVDKFINKISLFNFILGYVTIILGSDVMNFTRGMMYDVPVTFGMISLFTVILIIFNLKETKKLTGIKLVFAGIFTGFVVMSKPSLIGYYILIFYLLYDYLKLYKDNKKVVIKRFLLFFIPLSILGIIQMYFNYIRFDSIFDFGALRQLTVADMNVQTGFSIIAIIKGFSRFLFTLPHIEIFKFPFINTYDNNYYYMGFNEYEYENSVSGIFFIPIIWGLFLKNKLKKGEKEEKKLWHVANLVIITVCVLVTIISCFAGAAESYFIDIKLMLVIMSVVVLLKIIEKYKVSDKIELEKYNQIFFILCIVSIFLVLPQSFSTEASSLENMYMPINIVLSNFFMFWL